MLNKEPNLHCENCFDIFVKTKSKPRCRTDKGCPIIDVAPLLTINKRVQSFRQYKILSETKTPESLLLNLLTKSGIDINDTDLLMRAEIVYSEYQRRESAKSRAKNNNRR